MKQIYLTFSIMLLLCVTALPVAAENINFADAEVKMLCIEDWDTDYDGELSMEEAAAVTSLNNMFRGSSDITSFDELQYFTSLTSIPDNAFYNCRKLVSIVIPEGVASITSRAFSSCDKLTSITVVSNNPVYDSRNDCNAIIRKSDNALVVGCKNTVIPNGVESIISSSFISYPTSIVIPSSVSSIGSGAFQHVSYLAVEKDNPYYDSREDCNAIIRKTDNKLLVGCKNTTIPSSVTSIGDFAFEKCGILNITIPGTVKSIGQCAFKYASLTAITLEEGIQSIGYMAFACCPFTSIHIPSSVSSIGEGGLQTPFVNCINLSSITVAEGNEYYDSRDNCNAIIRKSDNRLIAGCKSTIIPSSVKIIGSSAFHTQINPSSGEAKKTLVIPEGVTTIELDAFAYTLIRAVSIPSSVTSIDEYAFSQCPLLSTIRVERATPPATGNQVFRDCPITKLYVPSGCTAAYQADYPWNDMGEIIEYAEEEEMVFADENVKKVCVLNWDMNVDGIFSVTEAAAVTSISSEFGGNTTIASFDELQSFTGLTSIGNGAFGNCSSLTSIVIPAGVSSIGTNPFKGCSALTSLQVVSGNNTYDSRNDCNAIIQKSNNKLISGCKTTVIPANVTSIGSEAFAYLSSLTSVKIPANVTSIDNRAFYGCENLSSVYSYIVEPFSINSSVFELYYDNTLYVNVFSSATLYVPQGSGTAYEKTNGWNNFKEIEEISNLDFADANVKALCVANWDTDNDGELSQVEAAVVTSLGTVFAGNTTISSFDELQFFTGLTSISNNAFEGCSALSSVVLPDVLTSIGSNAFDGCAALASIAIPSGVTSIGVNAFSGCNNLQTVYVGMVTPVAITENIFENRANATLFVPVGSKAAYEAANYWKDFNEVEEFIVFADANVKAICVQNWDTNGDRVLSLAEAAAVTSLEGNFTKSDISSFNELRFFTGLTSIEYNAFNSCKYLESVILPDGITSIGSYAFDGCSLTSITIPQGVTEFGWGTFNSCPLTMVKVGSSTPISIGEYTFETRANATLYVPAGSKAAYEAADYWKEFKEIVEYGEAGDANGDGVVDVNDVTAVVNYIQDNTQDGFDPVAADANDDGVIDVNDITTIVNIIQQQ